MLVLANEDRFSDKPLHSSTRVSASKPDGDDGRNGVKLDSPAKLHKFSDDVLGAGDARSTAMNAF